MHNPFIRLGYLFTRLLLALHYKVVVRGAGVAKAFPGGIIIGLGHVAYVDPPIVKTQLARFGIYPRPVVYAKMYDSLRWVMRKVGGFRIESLQDGSSDWMAFKIRRTVSSIKQAIARGESILVYPSGQTKSQLKESLGGKSSVFELVRDFPEVPVLAVKIYGLYGSLWSRYFTDGARVPSFRHMLAIVARHPLRFLRRVRVEIEFSQLVLPPYDTPRKLNQFLECVYDTRDDWVIPGREQCRVEGFSYANAAVGEDFKPDPAIAAKVATYLGSTMRTDPTMITLEQSLEHDLGMDSLARVDMLMWIEEEFGKQVDGNADILLVRDLVAAAQGLLDEVEGEAVAAPERWLEPVREAPEFPAGTSTIPDAFFAQAERMGWNSIAMADELLGALTYRQVLVRAIALAEIIRTYDEPAIGVMLPASVGACIATLAVFLAGKRLVPLNWTNGKGPLDYAIALTELNVVLSSDAFLSKAAAPLSEETAQKIILFEDLRSRIGLRGLLRAKQLANRGAGALTHFGTAPQPDDVAVVLFTSGSETAPKGVPLTHRNITYNVAGALAAIGGFPSDVMLGFLPPFHSFGFTQIMMLCLLGGVKTAFEPDPKKFKRLALAIPKWNATLVAGTPDFLSGIWGAAKDEAQLATLRAVMSGAQKASDGLKQRVRGLGIEFLEGYGITETSPLISVTRPGEEPVGVGREIDGTRVVIVDPETLELKPGGEEGLILVAGPGVFGGYLGNVASPFIALAGANDGIRYYNTGDLGYRKNGSVVISGRKKRTRKFMGEMINLAMIEDILVSRYPSSEDGPLVAVEGGKDREGQPPVIALYTRDSRITLEDANRALKEHGLPPFCFVRRRCVLPEIPLLGTGKVNHRALPDPEQLPE